MKKYTVIRNNKDLFVINKLYKDELYNENVDLDDALLNFIKQADYLIKDYFKEDSNEEIELIRVCENHSTKITIFLEDLDKIININHEK